MKLLTAIKRKKPAPDVRILPNTFGERHVRVSSYLGDGIFLTDTNAIGCVYRLDQGIYDEPLTEEMLTVKVGAFDKLFRQILPGIPFGSSNVVIQVTCSQRRKNSFNFIDPSNDVARFLLEDEKFVASKGIIERTFYISVLVENKLSFLDQVKQSLALGRSDSDSAFLELVEDQKKAFDEELKRIENETDLAMSRLNDSDLAAYYNSILNYGEKCELEFRAPEFHSFKEQIFNKPMLGSGHGFDSGEEESSANIRVFVFTHLPDIFVLGRLKTFLNDLPLAWDFSWTMSHGNTELTTDMVARQMWFAVGPAYMKIREDLKSFDENIGSLNPYGKLSLKLIAYNIDKATERRILRYAIQYLNVPIICEDRLGPHMIATALPLNCGSEHNSVVGRHRTIRLAPALGFLPIYDGYKGTGYRLWRSNRGFECRYDRFDGEQNRTTITLGMAGGGKSVADGFDIMEFKARYPDSAVIIVDNKSSYERLADLLGGQVVKFDESYLKENPYSPFAIKDWEKEDIDLIVDFISSSIAWVNPYAEFTSDHTEILVEAIKMCVNNHAADLEWVTENPDRASSIPPHFTLMQVLEKLEPAADLKNFRGSLDAVDQLRKWLVPFTKTGQFGFLFSEHEKPREYDSHRFMVYDLGGISDKRLQSMAAQLVSLKLIRDIKKLSRATQKLIIFEELGVFLHGESETTKDIANRLVKNITKTVRKYNGIPHGITNGVEDFFDHPGGLSFWSQATRRIFLPMTPAMIEKLRAKAEDLDSADIDILQSLHIKDGAYTQAYIIIGQGRDKIKVVIDIPLSPTAGAVFMTSGSVCAYYDKLRSEGMKVVDALEKLSAHLERTMQ